MEDISPEHLLYGSIYLYLAAAFAAILFSRNHKLCTLCSQGLCISGAAAGAASSISLLFSGQESITILPFDASVPYLSVSMTLDHLSALFLLILSILTFCVSIYSIGYLSHYHGKRSIGLFQFLYASFILSMVMVFTANQAIFFFMAWEIMAVVSYFLVVYESEQEETRKAGLIYVVMTHLGSAFLLIAIMLMFYYTNSFALIPVSAGQIPEGGRNIMFLLFLIGFATKAGMIPLHIWLPYAHPAAPGNVSALMSGIMIKTAVYGLLRFVFFYLGVSTPWWGIVLLLLGIFSAVLGVLYAYIEQNIKKLLAYSSIENMGIIFIGLGVGLLAMSADKQTVAALALTASLLHCFNHTLFKGGLFLGVGSVHFSTHTKNMEELGGLIKRMPVTAVFFLGCALSISAVVPFNGFIGEWLTYQSIFASITSGSAALNIALILSAAALALTGALAAACFIKLFGISFLGLPRSESAAAAKEVPFSMSLGTGILAVLCLLAGLFPKPMIALIGKAVTTVAKASADPLLQGSFLDLYRPIDFSSLIPEVSFSGSMAAEPLGILVTPLFAVITMVLLVLAALLLLRLFGGTYQERKYGTWDCGFKELNPRMQYSGTAFSKPIKIVFKIFFRSSKDLKRSGDDFYHPKSMEYTIITESPFEKYFYIPLLSWITGWSRRLKFMIQTGSIHTYLLYIFVAVLVLMLYNRMV